MTPEQAARNMLERMGWDQAQSLSSGDVVELANLLAAVEGWRGYAWKDGQYVDNIQAYFDQFRPRPQPGAGL